MDKKKIIFVSITILLIIVVVCLSFVLGDTSASDENAIINKKAFVEDITFDDKKVNIYFFWGDGCPHCADAHSFFDSIKEEYKDYFNLYGFEVWYNDENHSLYNTFAKSMGEKPSGVPYYIIGEKTFAGYTSGWNEEIINTIKNEASKNSDIYFDVIKKKINY